MQNNLQTSFCGMPLSSPIILLSGCVGFGEEYTRIKGFSNSDIGAIEINISCPNVKEGGVAFGNHSIMHGFMLSKVLDDRLVGWHSEVRKNVLLNLLHNYTYQRKAPGKNNKWLM